MTTMILWITLLAIFGVYLCWILAKVCRCIYAKKSRTISDAERIRIYQDKPRAKNIVSCIVSFAFFLIFSGASVYFIDELNPDKITELEARNEIIVKQYDTLVADMKDAVPTYISIEEDQNISLSRLDILKYEMESAKDRYNSNLSKISELRTDIANRHIYAWWE